MSGYIGSKAAVVSNGAERKKTYSITGTTTSLTGLSYTVNQVHVFHNGVRLVDGTDFTATNGNSITLTNAAQSGDEVVVISYAGYQVSDSVSASNGGTFSSSIDVNADGATVLTVDRASTDGTIIDVQKDGTTVGSIRSRAGVASTLILDPRTSVGTGVGITGSSQNAILPTDAGGNLEDAAIDFGDGSTRYKDLYLSGGVYLGGTGTSNKLTDYEEGTFTPEIIWGGVNAETYSRQQGSYVKVGGLVVCSIAIIFQKNTSTGNFGMGGLPFACNSSFGNDRGTGSFGYWAGISNGYYIPLFLMDNAATFGYFRIGGTGSANSNGNTVMHDGHIDSEVNFHMAVVYRTNS